MGDAGINVKQKEIIKEYTLVFWPLNPNAGVKTYACSHLPSTPHDRIRCGFAIDIGSIIVIELIPKIIATFAHGGEKNVLISISLRLCSGGMLVPYQAQPGSPPKQTRP